MALIGMDIRKLGDYGIGTYIRNLVTALAEIDRDNEYLLLHRPGEDLTGLPERMGTQVEGAGLYSLREPFRLGRSARRAGLDLMHCPHYVTPFRPGCPLAVTVHDIIHLLFPEYLPGRAALAYARFFLRRAARRARVIFAVSESTKRDILERLSVPEERVLVTRNAVDPRMLKPVSDAESEAARRRYGLHHPYVLYTGNLKPHKNLGTAVDAFASFRRKAGNEWRFVIAGRELGGRGDELLRRIERAGVSDAVSFLGFVAARDLPAVYCLAGLFLFPSLYEGFGLPPLEAMAAGVPVVASNRPSLPEILGDAALLVDPLDAGAMAAAMERATGDDELRKRLIRRGRQRARSFSWRETAEKTLAGYRRALGAA